MRALVAGSTGFVGTRLAHVLRERDHEVRSLTRDPSRAKSLAGIGCQVVEADLTRPESLHSACDDVDVAYYLVHMMGGDAENDFSEAECSAAKTYASACRRAGVKRMIYLGGLGDQPRSRHLRSRHATAQVLEAEGPPLTYFRASIVIGPESASFRLLRDFVERLPLVLEPDWLANRTQPIGIEDVIDYLVQALDVPGSTGREVQIGGPDVVSYSDLLDEMALALGMDPRPTLRMPGVSTEGAAAGASAVTRGDPELAAALTESLSTETIVTDPSGAALFGIEPEPLALVLSKAIDEQEGVVRPTHS